MRFSEEIHAESALTYTSAYSIRKFAVKDHPVEFHAASVISSCKSQLSVHRLLVDSDPHRRDLECAIQHVVPEDYIAVQLPVIIIRSSSVVLLARFQLSAYFLDENGTFFSCYDILAFLRSLVRIHILQLLRGYKEHLVRKLCLQFIVKSVDIVVEVLYGIVKRYHGLLQIFFRPVFLVYDFLPVPLVHIDGVKVVELLIAPYRVHVRVKPCTRLELVSSERHSLPFCKRLHDLYLFFIHVLYRKAYSTFNSIQVVVQSGFRRHEQRCGNSAQPETVSQLLLEKVLYFFNRSLTFHVVNERRVVLRDYKSTHYHSSPLLFEYLQPQ